MSLTSIISDRDNQGLRNEFKKQFLRPEFSLITDIKAVPFTSNGGIVGTAFDYLMRFYLQNLNSKKSTQRDHWVADHSYRLLFNYLSTTPKTEIPTGFNREKIFNTKTLLKIISDQYEESKLNYLTFIKSGQLTNKLISSTIFLAKLDLYFRAGIIDQNFDYHQPDDIKDINSLISIVDKSKFLAKERCYFNPTFGAGSKLVGGADADLIIDNTLIDIKTTKHLKLDREHLNQVIGYYILSLIGGVNNNPKDKPIENLGIYFARHGELWTIPISQLGNKRKFEDFKKWFISFIQRKNNITIKRNPNQETEIIKIISRKRKVSEKNVKKSTIKTNKKKIVSKKSITSSN